MNCENFYYKYLLIDYDQNDISNFLAKWPLTESRFHPIDVKEAENLLPSVFAWFKEKNIKVTQIFLINHKPDFKQDIHVDYVEDTGPKLAINFPLNNAASESITRVYDFVNERQSEKSHRDNKVPYSYVSPEHVVKMGEYNSSNPVLLNITKPHSAWNNTDYIRGVITFRFEKDPDFLIKD
jgi:hypothetical protein